MGAEAQRAAVQAVRAMMTSPGGRAMVATEVVEPFGFHMVETPSPPAGDSTGQEQAQPSVYSRLPTAAGELLLYHALVQGACDLCDREGQPLLLVVVRTDTGAEHTMRVCGTDLAGALAIRATAYDQGLPKP